MVWGSPVVLDSGFVLPTSGPVAQLGARMNGIHEVTGSTPVRSTIPNSLILNDCNRPPNSADSTAFDVVVRRLGHSD
jgi:hypothetical protein